MNNVTVAGALLKILLGSLLLEQVKLILFRDGCLGILHQFTWAPTQNLRNHGTQTCLAQHVDKQLQEAGGAALKRQLTTQNARHIEHAHAYS